MNTHRFVWHDLNTKDLAGSKRFYGEIFNWKLDASANGPYVHITAGDKMIGGMRQMSPQESQPPNWLGYIGVADVAATVGKITSAGGKIYMPTTTMPNVGTFAVTGDPSGAAFAPWKSARAGEDVEHAGPPPVGAFCWDELVTTDPAAASTFYANVFGWAPKAENMGAAGTYTLFNRPGTTGPNGPVG
jgi:predicted enzyme related to lactoylglutathione lyase